MQTIVLCWDAQYRVPELALVLSNRMSKDVVSYTHNLLRDSRGFAVCFSHLYSCIVPGFDLVDQLHAVVAEDIQVTVIEKAFEKSAIEFPLLLGHVTITLLQSPIVRDLRRDVGDFGLGLCTP